MIATIDERLDKEPRISETSKMNSLVKCALLVAVATIVSATTLTARAENDAKLLTIEKDLWRLALETNDSGARFHDGRFGEFEILPSEIFRIRVADKTAMFLKLPRKKDGESYARDVTTISWK